MAKEKVVTFLEEMRHLANQKSPAILTGFALVGLTATAIAAFKAGPKAAQILEDRKKSLEKHGKDKQTRRDINLDVAKQLAPVMAPTIIMGTATAACMLGSHTISSKRIAVLSAAYTLSETTVKDLNAKMVEVLGKGKTQEIKEKIAGDKMNASAPVPQSQIIMTGNGEVLCKDLYSGQEFYSNAERVGQAINKISHDCAVYMYVSLNDFYEALGIEPKPMGNDLGWNADDLMNGSLPITISAQLNREQKPCLCIDYDIHVRKDFRNLN